MDATIGLQWFALSLLFLVGSIWSEDNARFGYIVTAFIGGFFWWIGWLQFAYLGVIIPIVFMIAIVSYLRSHLKFKFGVFGSQGGLIWKILMFIILLQFAIVIINGMAIFQTQYAPTPTNEFTGYSLTNAETVFGGFTSGITGVDMVLMILSVGWLLLQLVFSMLFAFFTLYPTMVTVFHMPQLLAAAISAAIYVLTGLELFMLIFKPIRSVEV
jgi:hypothetical protein